jgi:very-short-patch-repair endonuclease
MDSDRIRLVVPSELKQKALQAARIFRKNPTPSEAILWQALRGKKLDGLKFRRQQPIGPFVVDFYSPPIRLVIEIDGAVHEQQMEGDQNRQEILESLDLQFLRISATQVESDIDSVLSTIRLKAKEILTTMGKNLSPDSSSTSGDGRVPLPRLSGKGVGDGVRQHE